MSLNGAGGQVKLAQAPVFSGPSAPMPQPAPAPAPAVAPAGPPLPVLAEPVAPSGLSHGMQVSVATVLVGLLLAGAILLTD